jgi:hypothetical protein
MEEREWEMEKIEREKVGEKLRICSVSERTTYIQYLQKY